MKKIILGFLLVILSVAVADAQMTNKQKGQALTNFTDKQYDLLFESDLGNFSNTYDDIFSISKKAQIFEGMADGASNSRKNIESSVTSIATRAQSLEVSLKIIDHEIREAMEELEAAHIGIVESRKMIDANSKQIEIMQKKVESNTKVLLEYIDYLYKKGNTSFEEGEIDNIKSILLNNEDISDLVNDLYYNSLIQVSGKKLIDEHKQLITDLYRKKIELQNQKKEFSKLRKDQIILKNNLDDKKEFKENLLAVTRGKQELYEQFLDNQIDIEKKLKATAVREKIKLASIKNNILDKYNCKFVDISQNTAEMREMKKNSSKCFNINRMIYYESQLSKSGKIAGEDKGKNVLSWPITPVKGISAYFKDPGYKATLHADHNAIDIRASQGTPIRAPMDGYVLYINKPTTQDYSFVAIKHYDGYITVYGHLSEVNVEEYDFVEKGEIFAKTGGEYGTKGAGYITTGPHLHFEVFRNKEYIDPLSVLDTSFLNYNDLPNQTLKIKYTIDFKNRKGYAYKAKGSNSKMFHIEGKDEIERQKYFLSTYARNDFSDWQMWIDESLAGGIDPSLTMCIGLAESSLGKNLTTNYNIGNVGNNDRGDRVGLSGPQSGIRSIVSTLNNRYFSSYRSLDHLSGAGRITSGLPSCKEQGHYCYATDTNHWHNNVIRCLSHLKGELIPDNYNFRLQ